MTIVRELMATDPITVEQGESLRNAADLLTASGVSGAPVTSNGRVVGVVTLTDIMDFEAHDAGAPTLRPDNTGPLEEDTSEEGELPEEQEPDSSWFVDFWQDAGAEVTTRFETESPEWNTLDDHTVEEVMTRVICAVKPDANVQEAASLMEERSIHRVLVMEGEELRGVLSAWDIVRAVAHGTLSDRSEGRAA